MFWMDYYIWTWYDRKKKEAFVVLIKISSGSLEFLFQLLGVIGNSRLDSNENLIEFFWNLNVLLLESLQERKANGFQKL